MLNITTRRLQNELSQCIKLDKTFINNMYLKITLKDNDLFYWKITIIPNRGFYENLPLNFDFIFNSNYPFERPKIYTPYYINHPNISKEFIDNKLITQYNVCRSILGHNLSAIEYNLLSILIQLCRDFNTDTLYDLYPYTKKLHIFYDSVRLVNYGTYFIPININDVGTILSNLIHQIYEYNKDDAYLVKKIRAKQFNTRTYDKKKIDKILCDGLKQYCSKSKEDIVNGKINQNDILSYRLYADDIILFAKNLFNITLKNNKFTLGLFHDFIFFFDSKTNLYVDDNTGPSKDLFYLYKRIFKQEYIEIKELILIFTTEVLIDGSNKRTYNTTKLWSVIELFGYDNSLNLKNANKTIAKQTSKTIAKQTSKTISKQTSKTISKQTSKTIAKQTSKTISKRFDVHLKDLPYEILLKIINYLDEPSKLKMRLVDKYYYKIFSRPCFWERKRLLCDLTYDSIVKKDCILCLEISCNNLKEIYDKSLPSSKNDRYKELSLSNRLFLNKNISELNVDDNVYLPIISNINAKQIIEKAILQIIYKYLSVNNIFFKETIKQELNVESYYSLFHTLFVCSIHNFNVNFLTNKSKISKEVDKLSQLHYIYLKIVEWHPGIKKYINKKIARMIHYSDKSLKDESIFELIVLCGMVDDYDWNNLKKYVLKEALKKYFRMKDKTRLFNTIFKYNYNECYIEWLEDDTDIRKVVNRELLPFIKYVYEKVLIFSKIIQLIMRRDSFTNMVEEYSKYYGFLPRKNKDTIINTFRQMFPSNYLKPSITLKTIYQELINEQKWVNNRHIYNYYKMAFKCAYKNNYLPYLKFEHIGHYELNLDINEYWEKRDIKQYRYTEENWRSQYEQLKTHFETLY